MGLKFKPKNNFVKIETKQIQIHYYYFQIVKLEKKKQNRSIFDNGFRHLGPHCICKNKDCDMWSIYPDREIKEGEEKKVDGEGENGEVKVWKSNSSAVVVE